MALSLRHLSPGHRAPEGTIMKAAAKTDPVALVEADVSERFDEGNELATKHTQQKLDLEVRQRDRLLKLASRHAAELARLEARQLGEVGALWRRQGRQLGPGMRRQLGEISGWNGGTNGKTR